MIPWVASGKASILVGGQFGSEGKGLAAAWLASQDPAPVDIATTNAGAQAGHTTRFADGRSFVCFHLPTSGVMRGMSCRSYINAGSIIDLEVLEREIRDCDLDRRAVVVDPRASIITDDMRATESIASNGPARIASTMKGVGAAIADKVMRRAPLVQGTRTPDWLRVDRIDLNSKLSRGASVVVEVPQGLDLSLNHGFAYPTTTSRDCTVMAGISDAGIHPSFLGEVCMVVRTFPIRVGHAFNEQGELLGESGPFYPDSRELDWARDFPGVEPERTTVTKRVRRIATWSGRQYAHGLGINRPSVVFCNFCNYLPDVDHLLDLVTRMRDVEAEVGVRPHRVFGFGPCVEDVTDDLDRAVAWYDNRSL